VKHSLVGKIANGKMEDANVKKTVVKLHDRRGCYLSVHAMAGAATPERGIFPIIASVCNVSRQLVARHWKEIRSLLQNHDADHGTNFINDPATAPHILFDNKVSKRRGGKHKWNRAAVKAKAKTVPFSRRRKIRHFAEAMEMPRATLHKMLRKEKLFYRVTSALKPKLTPTNKHLRMLHALERIDPISINRTTRNSGLRFVEQLDEVHIDEKWFFICRDNENYMLVSDEEEPPKRHVKHKSHIAKVMFICALARPRRIGNVWWDGKIGMWPIGKEKLAQRGSVNRPAGTVEWEAENVDQAKHKCLLLNDVIPAIIDKWPNFESESTKTFVQQDGAKAHFAPLDQDFYEELQQLGIEDKIKLCTQPANSPDLNINDLGFFASLQSAHHCHCPRNELELIAMVRESFASYPVSKLNRLWVTLQSMMNEIVKCQGDNTFKIPHMNKDKLEREGRLPRKLPVDEQARCYLEE